MIDIKEALARVKNGINDGEITRREVGEYLDLKPILVASAGPDHAAHDQMSSSPAESKPLLPKLPVTRGLFYVAAIIVYAAVISFMEQTATADAYAAYVLATAGIGAITWLAVPTIKGATEVKDGLRSMLLLSGTLLITTGLFTITKTIDETLLNNSYIITGLLATSAIIHIIYFRYIKDNLIYLASLVLATISFGLLSRTLLLDMPVRVSDDVLILSILTTFGLLSWLTHIGARLSQSTKHLAGAFDKLLIVATLITMYVAAFNSDTAKLWYMALILAIIAIYYLSIIAKQRILLGTASTALAITTITIATRYFSNYGISTSLILSALIIVGVALITTKINKRYLNA